jgi:hypothetical protein
MKMRILNGEIREILIRKWNVLAAEVVLIFLRERRERYEHAAYL